MDFKITLQAKKERTTRVKHNQTTSFLWEGENVFSTPSMISEMEETCRLLLKEQFLNNNDQWDSVGTIVDIKHLAATPVGAEITLNAEIIKIDERRILFKVSAKDKVETIGEGLHERFIINIPRFRERFIEKVKKVNE
ncbi:MAG TPA: thioesterase family protein [Candidatus Nitrosocosmicus sp.]|jgi:predicted thioesterase